MLSFYYFENKVSNDNSNQLALTCKYRNWRAAGDSEIISDASLRAPDAFFSPSAAMTYVANGNGFYMRRLLVRL